MYIYVSKDYICSMCWLGWHLFHFKVLRFVFMLVHIPKGYTHRNGVRVSHHIWQFPLQMLHLRNPPNPETQIPRYKLRLDQNVNSNSYREIPNAEKSKFLDLVDCGSVAISVETVIPKWYIHTHQPNHQHIAYIGDSLVTNSIYHESLQHTATHSNTLQHTATHCNTLHFTNPAYHTSITNWKNMHAYTLLTNPLRGLIKSGSFLVAARCSVCCSMSQIVVVCCRMCHTHHLTPRVDINWVVWCCSMLQCVAVLCRAW